MADRSDISPPKWADRCLSWFCKDELLEEVRGDLHEFYGMERAKKSALKANWSYWYHMLHFLRPFAIKKRIRTRQTPIAMYRSYIKTGFRNLKRQQLASFINVFGLATTIAISLVVYVLIDRQFSLDDFHTDADQIFAVQTRIDWNGTEETWGRTPLLLGPSLEAEVPQVTEMARVSRRSATVRFDDNVFNERLTYADPGYLSIFNFPLSQGQPTSLESKKNIILSLASSEKYFPRTDPIGKDLKIIIDGKAYLFTVTGVAQKFPENASFTFDFLLPFENLKDMHGLDLQGWHDIKSQSVFTFIKLDQSGSSPQVASQLKSYSDVVNEINTDWPVKQFGLYPLPSLARNAQYVRETYASGSTPEILVMFAIISLLLLASACFNYVNISVSMAQKRLSEIAIRKVVGGQRKQLIGQFLTENFVLCFVATIIGALLGIYVLLPGINVLFSGSGYTINIFQDPAILGFLVVLFIALSLISGAYPAFYISSFKPVAILKGKENLSGKNRLGKVFLTAQFFLTFIAIVSGFLFTSINEFQEDQDWGYQASDLLVVPVGDHSQYQALKQFASQSPGIVSSAGSGSQIGISSGQTAIRILDDKFTVRSFNVGPAYFGVMDIDITKGRGFEMGLASDEVNNLVVNQAFIEQISNGEAPFDQLINIDGESYKIVGVTENFHFDDFFSPITPAIFRLVPEARFNYISLKTVPGGLNDTEALVKAEWTDQFPDSPYAGFFQEEVFDNFFASTGSLKSVMNFVAMVAIILSAMGLFGLVSLFIIKKLKEYSIRKVLGAHGGHIIGLVSKQFIVLMSIALIIAAPFSYYGFELLFEQMFPGSIDTVSAGPFLITTAILLAVIFLTISSHILQLLRMNPVKNLRLE
ncbi:MAG: FtsX-like permease family protein [Roseivirga sp.]|nr:FtsX-like permease family protein [Roseivirga sp.]